MTSTQTPSTSFTELSSSPALTFGSRLAPNQHDYQKNFKNIQWFYENGSLKYFNVPTLGVIGGEVAFTGKFPVDLALKYAKGISTCMNCLEYAFWCGECIGMCENCGEDTGTQKGFGKYFKEADDESSANRPSVFNMYLKKDWNLEHIGDKNYVNTIRKMVDELILDLTRKFGPDKQTAILGLANYVRSLYNKPREALLRIEELNNIPEEQLYNRNWAQLWGPHYNSDGDYIGYEDDDEDEEEEERRKWAELREEDEEWSKWATAQENVVECVDGSLANSFDMRCTSPEFSRSPPLPSVIRFASQRNTQSPKTSDDDDDNLDDDKEGSNV